jgi:hypothetical protein
MHIPLKHNNEPTKPGFYLVKRENSPRTEVAEIRYEFNELRMFCGIGIYSLKDCGPALWSDEITFSPQIPEKPKLEDLAEKATQLVRSAINAAKKYNDFGSVLGAQDEAADIQETLLDDLGRSATRAQRLSRRIQKWETGDRTAPLL